MAATLVVAAFPYGVEGHGRNPSVVRMDMRPESLNLAIEVVAVDLLGFIGMGLRQWNHLGAADQEARLFQAAEDLVNRIRVYGDEAALGLIGIPRIDGIALNGDRPDRPALDQWLIRIYFDYGYDNPPHRVSVWSQIYDAAHGDPIPFQFMVYREGELVLLPTEWSAGFALRVDCRWDEEAVSLSRLSALKSATSDWRNRLPYALLEVKEGLLHWTIRIPCPYLWNTKGLSGAETDPVKWTEGLVSGLRIAAFGEGSEAVPARVRLIPLSGHGLLQDRKAEAFVPEQLQVEFSMSLPWEALPERVAISAAFPLEVEDIFTDVLVFGKWRTSLFLEREKAFEAVVELNERSEME
jgi:hypothetical protein